MKTPLLTTLFLLLSAALLAQPGDPFTPINEQGFIQPFLQCVVDEVHFANYAAEAHSAQIAITDTAHCKLHIPSGYNRIWKEIEASKKHKKGLFDYSRDFWTGIRFNFYINAVKVSTAYHDFEKPSDTDAFTLFFDLNPNDQYASEGDLNYAYRQMLSQITRPQAQIYLEAAIPSKDLVTRLNEPFALANFWIHVDLDDLERWKKQLDESEYPNVDHQLVEDPIESTAEADYNQRLKYLADSVMSHLFGTQGFQQNFTMSCFQNPCLNGEMYANTFFSSNPCSFTPQTTCKEALVTYAHVKTGVPLSVKLSVVIQPNGERVIIENNPFGQKEIALEKQNILPLDEIQREVNRQFPKEKLAMLNDQNALGYSHGLKQPKYNSNDKTHRDPGYRVIKETQAGKNWENGFIYYAFSTDERQLQRIYHFDATTGELLTITEVYETTN